MTENLPQATTSEDLRRLSEVAPPPVAVDGKDPAIMELEAATTVLVANLTQEVQALAEKAGVRADVAVRIILNPK